LKHGPLALIEEGVPVVALATQPDLAEKLASNVQEVRARGGRIYAVAREGDERLANLADQTMLLPAAPAPLMPILGAIPLQLVAYHAALQRGCDVDKPRNLAKSVTVE
jgi:glucosamine--fructose-6-phosphate aminotransferase (isomerizing)